MAIHWLDISRIHRNNVFTMFSDSPGPHSVSRNDGDLSRQFLEMKFMRTQRDLFVSSLHVFVLLNAGEITNYIII